MVMYIDPARIGGRWLRARVAARKARGGRHSANTAEEIPARCAISVSDWAHGVPLFETHDALSRSPIERLRW